MAYVPGVVWCEVGGGLQVKLINGNLQVFDEAPEGFHRGDLVLLDMQNQELIACPPEAAERTVVRIDHAGASLILGSTSGFSQVEVLAGPGVTPVRGETYILGNGRLLLERAPDGIVKSLPELPDPKKIVADLKSAAADITTDQCAFVGYADVLAEAKRAVARAFATGDYAGRLRPPKGMLLTGPPGTGKTTLARKLAKENDATLYVLRGPEVLSRWVGASEAALRSVFEDAEEAERPIIFLDEVDSLTMDRGRSNQDYNRQIVATLLTLMDGFEKGPGLVIGTTNRVEDVDPAFLRAGRFDLVLALQEPSADDRREILASLLSGWAPPVHALAAMTSKTGGWSGADLLDLAREAAGLATDDGRRSLWASDLDDALQVTSHRRRGRASRVQK